MSKGRVVADFWAFLRQEKKYWLVPIGFIWRLTGKDPLARRRRTAPGWSPYPNRYRDRRHYLRMY